MMSFEAGDGVLYLNVGVKHMRNLAISLWSLRKIYDGPVAILVGDDAVEKTYDWSDSRKGNVEVIPFPYSRAAKRNSVYAAKTSMHKHSPFMRSVFLDSDTVINKDFSDLLPIQEELVCWTSFANWDTKTERKIRNRITSDGWPEVFPKSVAYQLANAYPALNTGVIGFSRTSTRQMDKWNKATMGNICFICDEVCAQLIAFDYPSNILDHRWNASPKYSFDTLGLDDLETSDAKIIHCHGNKGFKVEESHQHIHLHAWFSAFHANFLGIQDWDNKVWMGRKHPSKFVKNIPLKYAAWCDENGLDVGEIPAGK